MRNGPKPDTTPTEVPDLRVTSSLTEIERRILDFMVLYLRTNTYQPSIREIGEQFGIKSTKTVSEHLQALADKGFLERDPSRSRGVRIVGMDLNAQTVTVPYYQDLAEASGGVSADGSGAFVSFDRRFVSGKGAFLVQAPPDKLLGAGIGEGDLVVIEPVALDSLKDGELVVARVGDATDYFRIQRSGGQLFLHPVEGDAAPRAVAEPMALGLVGRVSAFYRRVCPLADAPTTAH